MRTINRIEMNGEYYLSTERVASLLKAPTLGMAERQDFLSAGRFVIYEGVHDDSEIYCQQLVAQNDRVDGLSYWPMD